MTNERINNWVGYSQDINRDVFCAVLTGLCSNPKILEVELTDYELIKKANNITLEFFKQQNFNK